MVFAGLHTAADQILKKERTPLHEGQGHPFQEHLEHQKDEIK